MLDTGYLIKAVFSPFSNKAVERHAAQGLALPQRFFSSIQYPPSSIMSVQLPANPASPKTFRDF
jgi:hypothetical protein